jgi:hypothetical protein
MKKIITTFLLIGSCCLFAFAQDSDQNMFDFWVGRWEVTWDEGDGKTGKGTNNVVKILGNTVIGILVPAFLFIMQKVKPGIRVMQTTTARILVSSANGRATSGFSKPRPFQQRENR